MARKFCAVDNEAMMKNHRIGCMLIINLTWLMVSGCADFRGGEIQQPTTWPLSTGPGRQSISLVITVEMTVTDQMFGTDQNADVNLAKINALEQLAEKAYKESGLFPDIKIGAAETDLRAEIHLIHHNEYHSALMFLWYHTMTLIPFKVDQEFVIKTVLKNNGGQQLGFFEKKEPMTSWSQLFLIFIMPFQNKQNTVETEVLYDLNRATIIEAYNAGLLARRH